jgi:hypothetical protein
MWGVKMNETLASILNNLNEKYTADFNAWITDDVDYLIDLIEGLDEKKETTLLEHFREKFCEGCEEGGSPEPVEPDDKGY